MHPFRTPTPLFRSAHGLICLMLFVIFVSAPAQAPLSETRQADEASLRLTLVQVEQLRAKASYEEGLVLAQNALSKAEALGDDTLLTEALYQISILYYFLERFEDARAYMEIGLTHARLHGLKAKEADLLNAQGVLEWKQGNLLEATAKLERALGIREDAEEWVSMASIANNLGIIAYSMERFSDAVHYYEKGLNYLSDRENDRLRASLYSNLGESLIPLGRFEEAEFFLLKSLELENAAEEPLGIAYTYLNLGELRSGQGLREQSIDFYRKALAIQQRIDNNWAASLTRLRLAKEYRLLEQPTKALDELKTGYETAKELNALPILRDYCREFADLYHALGKPGKADYYKTLGNWITREIQGEIPSGRNPNEAPSMSELTPPIPPSSPFNLSLIRGATLALLLLLIFILVIENMRLRRLGRGK